MEPDASVDRASLPLPRHLRVVPAGGAARPPRLLRRYANRKLYDGEESRYLNLEEVAQLVRTGHEVRVVEHETGRDLTGLVLAQIVAADEAVAARCARALARMIGGDRAAGGDGAPAPPAVPSHGGEVLNEGHRLTMGLRAMAAASRDAVSRLQAESNARLHEGHDVVAALARLKRELAHIARRIDFLHERLRALDRTR